MRDQRREGSDCALAQVVAKLATAQPMALATNLPADMAVAVNPPKAAARASVSRVGSGRMVRRFRVGGDGAGKTRIR